MSHRRWISSPTAWRDIHGLSAGEEEGMAEGGEGRGISKGAHNTFEADIRALTTSLAEARAERNRLSQVYTASQRTVVRLRLALAEARTRQRREGGKEALCPATYPPTF